MGLTEAEVELLKQKLKLPVFIGTAEPQIANKLAEMLTEPPFADRNFEVCVLTAQMFSSFYTNFLFSQLSLEQQAQAQTYLTEERYKEQAETQAIALQERFKLHLQTDNFEFTEQELKNFLTRTAAKGKNVSHADTWNLMDLLLLHGYLKSPSPIGTPRHKVKYQLTIATERKLEVLSAKKESLSAQYEALKEELNSTKAEIKTLRKQQQDERATAKKSKQGSTTEPVEHHADGADSATQ